MFIKIRGLCLLTLRCSTTYIPISKAHDTIVSVYCLIRDV